MFLRVGSSLVLTSAAAYLWYALWERRVRPSFVWGYLAMVVTLMAMVRWTVTLNFIGLLTPEQGETVAVWQPSINQSLYILLGMAVIILARTHIKSIGEHYRREHDG